jgi:hypothetical protein
MVAIVGVTYHDTLVSEWRRQDVLSFSIHLHHVFEHERAYNYRGHLRWATNEKRVESSLDRHWFPTHGVEQNKHG